MKSWYEKTKGLSMAKGMVFEDYLMEALMPFTEVDWALVPEICHSDGWWELKDKKERAKSLILSVHNRPVVDSINDVAEAVSIAIELRDEVMRLIDENGGQALIDREWIKGNKLHAAMSLQYDLYKIRKQGLPEEELKEALFKRRLQHDREQKIRRVIHLYSN